MTKRRFDSSWFRRLAQLAGVAVLLGAAQQVAHAQGTMDDSGSAPIEESYSSYSPKERAQLRIAYSMAFPHGGLNDFAGDASFRGFDLVLLWPLFKGLSAGAGFGFNGFYEEHDRTTYEQDNGAITGKLYRYVDYWNFSAVAHYAFLKPQSRVRPYVGLRLGVAALSMTTLIVDLSYQDAPAGFLVVPEAGVNFNVSRQITLYASYQWNYSTASSDDFNALNYSSIQLGISLGMGAM